MSCAHRGKTRGTFSRWCSRPQGMRAEDLEHLCRRTRTSTLGSIAEFDHALMSERTRDGLAAARARGRTGGQKPKLGPRQVALAQAMYDETADKGKRRYTVAAIAAEFGVTRPTIYRHLAKQASTN